MPSKISVRVINQFVDTEYDKPHFSQNSPNDDNSEAVNYLASGVNTKKINTDAFIDALLE
jgi:hypothetical protein